MVTTSPLIEGLADGCNVLGVKDGERVGSALGVEVMNTDCESTVHWSSTLVSNAVIAESTSSVFVASTVNDIAALIP